MPPFLVPQVVLVLILITFRPGTLEPLRIPQIQETLLHLPLRFFLIRGRLCLLQFRYVPAQRFVLTFFSRSEFPKL